MKIGDDDEKVVMLILSIMEIYRIRRKYGRK